MVNLNTIFCLVLSIAECGPSENSFVGGIATKQSNDVLQKELMKDEIWMVAGNQKMLLEYLQEVYLLRPRAVAPILAKNIAFSANKKNDITMEEQYPAYKALRNLGMSGVKAIVMELMSLDPVDIEVKSLKNEEQKIARYVKLKHRASNEHIQSLLIYCLIQIYDEGGFGIALARHRLELEATNAKGEQKDRLMKALKHPFFK